MKENEKTSKKTLPSSLMTGNGFSAIVSVIKVPLLFIYFSGY